MRKVALLVVFLSFGVAGCGGGEGTKEPVTIALLAPKTGPLSGVGTSFESVFNVAVDNINEQGGIDGRDLIGITLDTQLAVDGAPPIDETFQQAVDMGAVAVVGPAASGEVTGSYPVARDDKVPLISPSSTAPSLSLGTVDDDGYMFRNVPDDNIQGIAMSYYLGTARVPTVDNVAVLYEMSDYGDGLRGSFVGKFTGAPISGTADVQVDFPQGLVDDAAADAAIAELATDMTNATVPPTMIVMVALEQDAIKLVNAWDRSVDPIFDNTVFFMTDGARSQAFATAAPASLQGMCGTAPTFPVDGVAYDTLETAFETANPGEDIDAQVFAPNVWDATHILAAALAQQQADSADALGGAGLRDAITPISKNGTVRTADEWREILQAIRAGTDIDYDGAAGPNDFDGNGQAIGPYEVWCLNGTSFEQELFMQVSDLTSL